MYPLFQKSSYEDVNDCTHPSELAGIYPFYSQQKEIVWLYCAHRSAAALSPMAAGMNSIDHGSANTRHGNPGSGYFVYITIDSGLQKHKVQPEGNRFAECLGTSTAGLPPPPPSQH